MKLSIITTLAALMTLSFAGTSPAQSSPRDPSVGNVNLPTGICTGLTTDSDCYQQALFEFENEALAANVLVVSDYQKQLSRQAAEADSLIEANRENLSGSCLMQVEILWRGMRNAYSSTGGQLPLYGPHFDRNSPEFRGYVVGLVDQSRQAGTAIESLVARNCRDPSGTSLYRGEVAGS